MTTNNKYIQFIVKYAKENTPIELIINKEKLIEIESVVIKKNMTPLQKELLIAVYTLFYTAVELHKQVKSDSVDDLSYHILLADYMYSYCTEILYDETQFDILRIFGSKSKQVILDILDNRDTHYFLDALVNSIKD